MNNMNYSNLIQSLLTAYKNLEIDASLNLISFYKKGSKIHIKKENRGKFTAAAKRAGMGVLEYATKVLRDPHASPLLKKRANFARNAKKWKH